MSGVMYPGGAYPGGYMVPAPSPTDWVADLSIYFPLEQIDTIEDQYFQRHLSSFIANQNINNDSAILSLHQLFMFCAYGLVYAVIKDKPEIIQHAFTLATTRPEERRQLQSISSPFTLSLLNERTFFEALSLAGVSTDRQMKPLRELVDWRNDLAHCNGALCISFDDDVKKYLSGFEILHDKFEETFSKILVKTNEISFESDRDIQFSELRALLSRHYISRSMLERVYPLAKPQGLQKNAQQLIDAYMSTI